MSLFQEKSYRSAIERIVSSRKHLDSRMRFGLLAESMRIQKSYLSKVLRGDAHLSTDQLYLGCKYLGLTPEESKYLQLLLEFERSTLPDRKESLRKQVERMQAIQLESKKHLKAGEVARDSEELALGNGAYYLDPTHQLVHIALTVPKYLSDPRLISQDLGIEPERVEQSIDVLTKLGVLAVSQESSAGKRARGKIELLQTQVHLPRESPFYRPWRAQLRQWALQRLLQLDSKKAYTFSVVFSADEETRTEIQAKFLEFLSWTEKRVAKTKPERVYQMNFDLFRWLG